jgi:hypothetical protein
VRPVLDFLHESLPKEFAVSEPMDKAKKVKLIVSSVAILVGGLLILNQATDDGIRNAFMAPAPPEPPKIDAAAQEQYQRRKEQLDRDVANGVRTISGS